MAVLSVPTSTGELVGRVVGSGPPMLLLHGGPGLEDYLAPLADELASDWTVAHYTQRGTAPSTLDGDVTVTGHVEDVLAVLDHLGWPRCVLAGHSWGGHLAMHVAVRHPERLVGLIALDALGGVGDGGYAAFGAALMARVLPQHSSRLDELEALEKAGGPLTPEQDAEALALMWPAYFPDPATAPPMPDLSVSPRMGESFESMLSSVAEIESRLAGCQVPALFVHGEDSPMPVESSTETVARLPYADVEVLTGAGHFLWIDRPGVVQGLVNPWWSRVSANGRVPRG